MHAYVHSRLPNDDDRKKQKQPPLRPFLITCFILASNPIHRFLSRCMLAKGKYACVWFDSVQNVYVHMRVAPPPKVINN